MKVTLELREEQVQQIAVALADEMERRGISYKKRTKPFTVREFHEATGIPVSSIYVEIKAERLRKVPDCGSILIPASELERFL